VGAGPTVRRPGIVVTVAIGDQARLEGAHVEQRILVAAVARQPRALLAEHDADVSQRDLGEQVLVAIVADGALG
jgi:hypothetical protein